MIIVLADVDIPEGGWRQVFHFALTKFIRISGIHKKSQHRIVQLWVLTPASRLYDLVVANQRMCKVEYESLHFSKPYMDLCQFSIQLPSTRQYKANSYLVITAQEAFSMLLDNAINEAVWNYPQKFEPFVTLEPEEAITLHRCVFEPIIPYRCKLSHQSDVVRD